MSAAKSTTPSRVTNVQVPGEAPKAPAVETPASAASGSAPKNEAPPESLKPAEHDSIDMETLRAREMDWEAMRARIREEERAILREELGAQMQAATTAASAVLAPPAPRSKLDYANMRAADIDHTTLTAPVRTLDGYLCPPAPEAKK